MKTDKNMMMADNCCTFINVSEAFMQHFSVPQAQSIMRTLKRLYLYSYTIQLLLFRGKASQTPMQFRLQV